MEQESPEHVVSHWDAEYQFFTKIIEDEVARLRWNQGFEPLDVDLYESKDKYGKSRYIGTVRICHRDFQCVLRPARDEKGSEFFRLAVRPLPRA